MRRVTVSPRGSRNFDDAYSEENSLEEVEAALNDIDHTLESTEEMLAQGFVGFLSE